MASVWWVVGGIFVILKLLLFKLSQFPSISLLFRRWRRRICGAGGAGYVVEELELKLALRLWLRAWLNNA